jgi:hypothetical protein
MRAALGAARKVSKALLEYSDHTSLLEGAVPYDEVNRLLGRKS